MNLQSSKLSDDDIRVLELLSEASHCYEDYLKLAKLGNTGSEEDEVPEQIHTWNTPLNLFFQEPPPYAGME